MAPHILIGLMVAIPIKGSWIIWLIAKMVSDQENWSKNRQVATVCFFVFILFAADVAIWVYAVISHPEWWSFQFWLVAIAVLILNIVSISLAIILAIEPREQTKEQLP